MKKYLILFFLFSISLCAAGPKEDCEKIIMSGIDALYNKEFSKSLELLTKAKIMAENQNWPRQNFLIKNNIALNYYYLFEYGDAIENYLEAYSIALKSLDSNYEMIVLNNIGLLYLKEKKLDDAERYLMKAYNIAKQNKYDYKIGLYATNLAAVYNADKQISKTEFFLAIAEPLVKKDVSNTSQVKTIKAENLINKKEYAAAKKILLELIPQLNIAEYNEYKVMSYLLLSKIYEQNENNRPLAIEMAKKALAIDLDLQSKVDIYERLSDLYFKNKEYDKAIKLKDFGNKTRDSITRIKSKIIFNNIKTKLKLQVYQKELTENKKKLAKERLLNLVLIGLVIIIILITFWALRNNNIKYRQKKIITDHNQKIIALELEKEKNDKLILGNELKNEIETKNRKIAVKALQSANRNELIEEIINSLSSLPEIANNQVLKNHILKLKNQLKSENEWDDFLTHFEEVNHSFLIKLKEKHNDLTSNDIRFILYIYMDLSIKEISSLLNITPEACRKRKERIAKKMNLSDSNMLYSYLSTI
jgi:tetratricopeptide (TPR) repeat protein